MHVSAQWLHTLMANSLVRRLLGESRSRYLLFPALLLVGATLLTGCKPAITDPKDPKFVVAEKGDWKITRAELDTEVGSFLKQHQATAEQVGPAKMPMVETMMPMSATATLTIGFDDWPMAVRNC